MEIVTESYLESANIRDALRAALSAMASHGNSEDEMRVIGNLLVAAERANADEFKKHERTSIAPKKAEIMSPYKFANQLKCIDKRLADWVREKAEEGLTTEEIKQIMRQSLEVAEQMKGTLA